MSVSPHSKTPPDTYAPTHTCNAIRCAKQPDVLIVEDDNDGRKILSMALRSEALSVTEAASGDEAQSLLDKGLRPGVLLTDMHFPGTVQGGRLANTAAAALPKTGIILMSGAFDTNSDHAPPPKAVMLNKPVTLKTILDTVSTMLSSQVPANS